MGGCGRVMSRLVVGVAIIAVLGGCATSVTSPPPPSNTPSIGAPSPTVATSAAASPSASAVTPAAMIELTGFSVRPFGLPLATAAFFAVDAAGNVYLPGGSKGAALDGGLIARLFALTYPKEVSGLVAIDPSHEDEWAGPAVDPFAPFGITTCTDASCPLYGDIQAVKKLEGGKLAGSLGKLPLVVLSHSPDLPFWNAAYDATWEKLGADTATASSNARHVIASSSTHMIPSTQPGLVIEALRQVVAAARAPDHALPMCGASFTQLGGQCQ